MEHPQVEAVWGPNPDCVRGYAFPINSSADGTKIAYGSGKNVVMRDVTNPSSCYVFSKHRAPVTVARFSHNEDSPQLVSADRNGALHLMKVNGNVLEEDESKRRLGIPGWVYDLVWYDNDQGFACVGESKGKNGRVFNMAGNDQGGISSAKRLTSVDMYFFDDDRKKFQTGKIVTTSDDLKVRVFDYQKGGFKENVDLAKGVKFQVNCNMARFSPDGQFCCVVGGKEIMILSPADDFNVVASCKGDKKKGEHAGNIYGITWNTDSKTFFTASADKTVKLWQVDGTSLKVLASHDLKGSSAIGASQNDFQVGCTSLGENHFASLSLSGDINLFSSDGTALKLEKTVVAPTYQILDADATPDGSLVVSTAKGEVILYNKAGDAIRTKGLKEEVKLAIAGVALLGNTVFSAGVDNWVRESVIGADGVMKLSNKKFQLPSEPICVNRAFGSTNLFVVLTKTNVYLMDKDSGKPLNSDTSFDSEATTAALSPDGNSLLVTTANRTALLYAVSGGNLKLTHTLGPFHETEGTGVSAQFSRDSSLVVIGLSKNATQVYKTADGSQVKNSSPHSGSVNDVDFSPCGKYLLSGGADGTVIIQKLDTRKFKSYRLAHPPGVARTRWISDSSFYSVGSFDASIKRWNISESDLP